MKVTAGRLTDADRALLAESNRAGRRVLVATLSATVTYDQHRPYTEEPMQAVGTVTTYDHDYLYVGGWSFTTRIAWADVVAVWWRDEAPSREDVDALVAEFKERQQP